MAKPIKPLLVFVTVWLTGCQQVEQDGPLSASAPQLLSGLHFQSQDTQALQADTFANPGLLWIDRGLTAWKSTGHQSRSCASCHGELRSMQGVSTRYPQYDVQIGGLLNIEGRINRCRTEQQNQPALAYESDELLALTAAVNHQSKGLPFAVSIDGPARAHFKRGREYFYQRVGQMNLACHHCHELNVGKSLRGDTLSHGLGNGYPTYRLEWQTLGSLHRRLRFCNSGIRAEPFEFGAAQYIDLELYLAWRAGQLPIETPAVRR